VPQLKTWLPALTGMTCLGLGAGLIGVYGFFVEHLSREFGVGVATINMGPVALLLVPGLMGPVVGKLVDRVSIRRIMLTGATIAMLALCFTSTAGTLALAALGFLGFAVGLSMYGPVVVNGLLVKVYPGNEARALAIAAVGMSLATIVLPPVVGWLLQNFDWRHALVFLALSVLLILWLVILAGIPGNPVSAVADGEAVPRETSIYRERTFWLVGLSVALAMNVFIVLAVCYPPHFTSRGFSVAEAGLFMSAAGMAGLTGKGAIALLADLVGRYTRSVAIFLLLLQVVGMGFLLAAHSSYETVFAICLLGFGGGGFLPMHPYLNSRYFDVRIIGQVNGAQMPLFLPFGLVGAPLAGYMFDRQGHYETVMMGLAVALFISAVLVFMLPRADTGTS